MADMKVSFVSQKISKVKWRLTEDATFQQADIFASGSWDNEDNNVSLWKINDSTTTDTDDDILETSSQDPQLVCDATLHGDVMDLQFVDSDNIIVGSSSGSALLYRYHKNSQTLGLACEWEGLHHFGKAMSPCTSVAIANDKNIATAGEDGRINLIHMEKKEPVRIMDNADSCCINGLTFHRQQELLLVSSSGQLKLLDIRQDDNQKSKIYCMSAEEKAPLQCVACHPTQPHIVATGSGDGSLCIWDLRQDRFPVNLLNAHKSTVWEIKFHPHSPDNLFTCSDDGTVWHWDGTSISTNTGYNNGESISSYTSAWIQTGVNQQRLQVTELVSTEGLPVNSLDIQGNRLVLGSDNEAVYIMNNIAIR